VVYLRGLRKFAGWQGKAYIQSGGLPQRSEEVDPSDKEKLTSNLVAYLSPLKKLAGC